MTDLGAEILMNRAGLATKYIAGHGIEIGALDAPYPVDAATAFVSYVDRFPKAMLLSHYPELSGRTALIRDPDIVDDGEVLASLADGSQDFVIASHFLEHCENPLAALANHCRVLRAGGFLLIAVPNTANPQSYDHHRIRTSFEHLMRDDVEGPQISRARHYREWVTFAGRMEGEAARIETDKLMKMDYSIHFHCWDESSFHDFLRLAIIYKNLPARVIARHVNDYEIAAVLQKTPSHADADDDGISTSRFSPEWPCIDSSPSRRDPR